jgi:hypothetical protein
MDKQEEQLETLSEIRSLMERSSRFISLSGLSGVCAGIFALVGAAAAYLHLNIGMGSPDYYKYAISENGEVNRSFYVFFFADAICVLIASLAVGIILTRRQAKQKSQPIWDATARRLFINLMLPLIVGGLFCFILLYHGLVGLIAPTTLLFYGLSLLNASKYTLNDIRYLGICEIALGLVASVYIGYGLLFWAAGFGILHIVYGTAMYFKYEK